MKLKPITYKEACRYVAEYHRHHAPPQGWKFGLAVYKDSILVGVAMIGRPLSRRQDDGDTLEITRICTDGTRNACSFLLGAAKRAVLALGYSRIITYILETESGVSLKAAGFKCVGIAGGGQWPQRKQGVLFQPDYPICKKRLYQFSSKELT